MAMTGTCTLEITVTLMNLKTYIRENKTYLILPTALDLQGYIEDVKRGNTNIDQQTFSLAVRIHKEAIIYLDGINNKIAYNSSKNKVIGFSSIPVAAIATGSLIVGFPIVGAGFALAGIGMVVKSASYKQAEMIDTSKLKRDFTEIMNAL